MDGLKKIDQAKVFKERGTSYVKNNQWDLALKMYKKAVEYLKDESDSKDDRNNLLLSVNLNLSLCYLKLKSPVEARDASEQALQLDSKNEKAMFRKGQANMELLEYKQAIKDFKMVLEIEPRNAAANKNIQLCNNEIKSLLAKEKKIYANMFEKLAKQEQEEELQARKIRVMESLYEYIRPPTYSRDINEDEFLQKLENCLKDGGDIDFEFLIDKGNQTFGTLLHYSIKANLEKIAEYAISRGASVAIETTCMYSRRNALEIFIVKHKDAHSCIDPEPPKGRMYEILKKRYLELYNSPYGLTSFHLDSAIIGMRPDDDNCVQNLQTPDMVNAAISTDSPIWPGMTPLLIAAKYKNKDRAVRLLDLGAVAIVRDPDGNTPLHYLYNSFFNFDGVGVCDERLFALDDCGNTFGTSGESHFHVACKFCPGTLHVVERYLEQGISPNLQTRSLHDDADSYCCSGLHLAAEQECPELVLLLLEHGADANKLDSEGDTPIDRVCYYQGECRDATSALDCVCLLIEAGASHKKIDTRSLFDNVIVNGDGNDGSRQFVSRMRRLSELNEKFVSKKLQDLCEDIFGLGDYSSDDDDDWYDADDRRERKEIEYAALCSKELEALSDLGVRGILDDTVVVGKDFKSKFRWLDDSFDYEAYPLYGRLLRMKFKRKLVELEKRNKKIRRAIPKVQWLFQKHGNLPYLCAELILWQLSGKELHRLIVISQDARDHN